MAKRREFTDADRRYAAAASHAEHTVRYNALKAQIAVDEDRMRREHAESRLASQELLRESLAASQRRAEEFDASNIAAAERLSAIDSILSSAVERPPFRIDDLAEPAVNPRFDVGDLELSLPKPVLHLAPPEPVYESPPQPQGLAKMFRKRQFVEAEQAARVKWEQEHDAWNTEVHQTLPALNQENSERYEASERDRLERLASARDTYAKGCAAREEASREDAKGVRDFKALVVANDGDAVLEFIEAILEHFGFPEAFPGTFEVEYDAESREATINLFVPDPASMPTVKAYKKLVTTGEVREVLCTQAEQRTRYNTAVDAAALRIFHEVFSAEPAGVIETASVTVGTETVDPATGQVRVFRLVEAAAAREDLLRYNLTQVEPSQTLGHMGAVISKNAFALKPVSDVRGVRK
jgi:restriction system protein